VLGVWRGYIVLIAAGGGGGEGEGTFSAGLHVYSAIQLLYTNMSKLVATEANLHCTLLRKSEGSAASLASRKRDHAERDW
jgi:hypothetical protein